MTGDTHLLTGDDTTGYTCSVCKQSWDKNYSLEEINAVICDPDKAGYHMKATGVYSFLESSPETFDTSHSYTMNIPDPFFGWIMSDEDKDMGTSADAKGDDLLRQWTQGEG
jgi:hypothetical protein